MYTIRATIKAVPIYKRKFCQTVVFVMLHYFMMVDLIWREIESIVSRTHRFRYHTKKAFIAP